MIAMSLRRWPQDVTIGRVLRPYLVHHIGYNYRTQELPAAFARSQLRRLARYNDVARRAHSHA